MVLDMVTLRSGTGHERTVLNVHQKLLSDLVEYWQKIFRRSLEEATLSSAFFPEDDVESFDIML